ncbi:flagellar protein FlaG [Phenylobacterium sp.]|uniref:flagellar protein FlaG n=1 Tax=Phenylobacterium sp. TaxID=1871053 RepID=UPI002737068D|nr:flagellar protein FlaG [Phenylobacterium sp.]MDP3855311.1 flagellar protein FlaG [Phenylobacterium sp.]
MENKLAAIAPVTDPILNQAASRRVAPDTGSACAEPVQVAQDPADLRLVIEEGGGSYVYKTIDRRTGEVVAQFPREEILKMREEIDYAAGTVISASA